VWLRSKESWHKNFWRLSYGGELLYCIFLAKLHWIRRSWSDKNPNSMGFMIIWISQWKFRLVTSLIKHYDYIHGDSFNGLFKTVVSEIGNNCRKQTKKKTIKIINYRNISFNKLYIFVFLFYIIFYSIIYCKYVQYVIYAELETFCNNCWTDSVFKL
jgi:hypothetical protein